MGYNQNSSELYPIYSIRMTNYLIRNGSDMIKITDSDRDSTGKYKVVWFVNDEKLHENIDNFMLEDMQRKIERLKKNRS